MGKLLLDNLDAPGAFKARVIKIIAGIPYGRVMSYGQVAAVAGSPRAARQVGGILRHYDGDDGLPWWRVVNNAGHISIKGNFIATPSRQKQLLEAEGVLVSREYSLDMEKYRFRSKI
jgi:methylated-DNA-protein-cysteine methyltransferase-like protein